MSITATLYTGESSTESVALTALGRHDGELLTVAVAPMRKPNFIREDYGVEPNVLLHFTLLKERSSQARAELGSAIRDFLIASAGDALLLYLDIPVIRRLGSAQNVAPGYEDLWPPGWVVSEIPSPA